MSSAYKFDFFLSRRGSVASVAEEVAEVLTDQGYKVFVQNYDIPLAANFIQKMDDGVKGSRDLVVLFTRDYETSPHTRKEFSSFAAECALSRNERRIVVLRCEDAPLRGLLADIVYQDLVGVADPAERKRRIVAVAQGHTQAQRPAPRPFVGVPPRIAGFTGRAEELDRLDAILVDGRPATVTQALGRAAVQGMGGVGKTSLATEYAHRFRALYAGVWWCPSETRSGILVSLSALAVTLGAAAAEEPDVAKAAKAGLRRLSEQRATWLLVYDNVTTPEDIADLLPSAGARVLITSRFSDFSGWADEVPVDILPIEEAVTFLQGRAGRRDDAGARVLAEAVGRLPLALDHAAATCRRTQMRFADYAVKAATLIATAPRGAAYPRSVAVTFDLAIAEATAECPAADALMAFLAYCAPERAPMTLVEGAIKDETERLSALAALNEVSLLKHDPFEDGTAAVTMHRLVQAVARAQAVAKGRAQAAVEHLTTRLNVIYPDDAVRSPQSWPLCAQLTPHLLSLRNADLMNNSTMSVWTDLLQRAGNFFHWRASYSDAEPLLRDAVAISEKVLGPEHPRTAIALNYLAGMLQDQGDLAEARLLFERALALHEKVFGDHPETAASLNNLAVLLRDRGDIVEARPLVERALSIRKRLLGKQDPKTATSMTTLALVHQAEGDLAGARKLLEEALSIRVKVLGMENPDTAHSLHNLARLLHAQGDLMGAHRLFARALVIDEKTLGREHPNTNRVRSNLARLLLAIGHAPEALSFGEAALLAHDNVLPRNHAWVVDSARVTADALEAIGRNEDAVALRIRFGVAASTEARGTGDSDSNTS